MISNKMKSTFIFNFIKIKTPNSYLPMQSLHGSEKMSFEKSYELKDFKKSFHGSLTICFKQSKKKRVRLISKEKSFSSYTFTQTRKAADLNPFSKS